MTDSAESKPVSPKRRRLRRWPLGVAIALFALAVGGELVARFALGLGDPPLYQSDPEMEFIFRPSSTYHRFGNLIHYNAYSMRSEDFPSAKADAHEVRVMVLGDSVINGGAQTDQKELATSLLAQRLAVDLGRPVVVGNISCGGWGPQNLLAYTSKYRQYPFDADVVVIVLSTHDYWQVREFYPLVSVDRSFPDHKPLLALQEAVGRYLAPRIEGMFAAAPPPQQPTSQPQDETIRQLIRKSQASGARVLVARHLAPAELDTQPADGFEQIGRVARDMGAGVVDLGPAFLACRKSGANPHRENDVIHPNAAGQRAMAEALLNPIKAALRTAATSPVTRP